MPCLRGKACEPELHIQAALVSYQLIQVDVLFGDDLANLKQLVLAVNFWSGFTMPLFASHPDSWVRGLKSCIQAG